MDRLATAGQKPVRERNGTLGPLRLELHRPPASAPPSFIDRRNHRRNRLTAPNPCCQTGRTAPHEEPRGRPRSGARRPLRVAYPLAVSQPVRRAPPTFRWPPGCRGTLRRCVGSRSSNNRRSARDGISQFEVVVWNGRAWMLFSAKAPPAADPFLYSDFFQADGQDIRLYLDETAHGFSPALFSPGRDRRIDPNSRSI